ncbi:hypothetical protein FB45DRAFT_890599 [Roridomyces roridus]|uniref:F-box domain-containing protein n=1 Tax=Roridomyces roridus TaxID=1738132 RepID=A0AAD7CE22_9AGAR|nr:hypothetical protein FB45DRAFT_890599 [Roridomyces roridus]
MELCSSYRAELLQSILAHKSIVAPVRRLPNELLVEIFKLAARDAFRHPWSLPWSQPPWTLPRVCRRWAAVSLGTASLWSRVLLNLDVVGVGQGTIMMTELLHKRSESTPLKLQICEYYEGETRGVLDVLLAHCERWQYVHLYLTGGSSMLFEIATIRGRLPILNKLKIDAELYPDDPESLAEFRDIFATAPNLTAVYAMFEDSESELCRPPFEFPWSQLTTLSIGFYCGEDALPILPQLSTIVNLRVHLGFVDALATQSPITLPDLRMLEIEANYSLYRHSLLSCLTTPLLEHLVVQQEANKDAILSFMTRSGCKLKSFHFIHEEICLEDVLSLVHEMPYLGELKIGDFAAGEASHTPVSITRALHTHWLGVRDKAGGLPLSVCIADKDYRPIDQEVASIMEKDGLFIKMSADWQSDSLVNAKFDPRYSVM